MAMKNSVFWDISAAVVRTYVSEEHIASTIKVTKIGELVTLAITNNRSPCEEILIPKC
jgi:hypothetical protein